LIVVTRGSQDADEVAELQELIRSAGLRSTAARMAVLRRLRKAKAPLSHAELAEELIPLGFDKATIFRNLNDLSDAGLVIRAELGDHLWRFELHDANHAEEGQHPHFVCIDCGSVSCLDDLKIATQLRTHGSHIGRVTEILFRGHCKACE
jgi:Fur family transcriptional regulator, ferric uptake regulator